jgi:NAD(P)-dependent dehydrogenase (short-subunit alcohol dehydrogenase family)
MTRIVLVTGAGGGIARILVKRLLARGDNVIASARRLDQIDELAKLGATGVAMDVSDSGSVRAGFAEIDRHVGGTLDAVVHCAAIAPVGTVEFTSPEDVAQILNINTLGALRMLQLSLPRLRKSKSGRFIFVSSLWGQVAGPFVSTYAASKHAVEALADSARRELRGQNIFLSVIEPGVVRTPMFSNQLDHLSTKIAELGADEASIYGGLYKDHAKLLKSADRTAISAEQCSSIIETCLDARRPRTRYRVGTDAKLLMALSAVLPDRALDAVFGLMYKS